MHLLRARPISTALRTEGGGIEPATRHYRTPVMMRDFRGLAVLRSDLRGARVFS